MSKIGCGQVVVPTVDNTSLECDEFVGSKCVKVDYNSTFFDGIVEPTLYDFFEQFEKILKDFKKSDLSQKMEMTNLKNEVKNMKTDINVLKKSVSDLRKEIKKLS